MSSLKSPKSSEFAFLNKQWSITFVYIYFSMFKQLFNLKKRFKPPVGFEPALSWLKTCLGYGTPVR